jgi:protein tyrosine phosphatase (PTP) superfamily phosphohydrolase (DUF442 family)
MPTTLALRWRAAALLAGLWSITGCSDAPIPAPGDAKTAQAWMPERIDSQHLPNALRLHEKVISGGRPEDEAAFQELRALGVKTIISVDSAQPQVELARRFGMRYIHLPHGYDGVPPQRAGELAKAVRDLPGPVYIHCHHGKHRSPLAAAVACVGAGLLPPGCAPEILRVAGTSESYRGLYESAEKARRFERQMLDELVAEYPERVDLPPLADAMIVIEKAHGHLAAAEQSGWRAPDDHPDLDPAHEALLLREHFAELQRTPESLDRPQGFRDLLRHSERAALALEESLRGWSRREPPIPAEIGESFAEMTHACSTCHREFRDVPLSEKE